MQSRGIQYSNNVFWKTSIQEIQMKWSMFTLYKLDKFHLDNVKGMERVFLQRCVHQRE